MQINWGGLVNAIGGGRGGVYYYELWVMLVHPLGAENLLSYRLKLNVKTLRGEHFWKFDFVCELSVLD